MYDEFIFLTNLNKATDCFSSIEISGSPLLLPNGNIAIPSDDGMLVTRNVLDNSD
jgi:hypothetical protein